MPPDTPSLREQLQAAYEAQQQGASDQGATPAGQDGAGGGAAAGAGGAEGSRQDAAGATSQPPEGQEAQPRDEHGRFTAKEPGQEAPAAPKAGDGGQTQAQPQPEAAKPAEAEAPKEPIRVPPSLPAALKAKFATLDPDVQQGFWKLEESVQTSKAEWSKKGERLNRFDEIIAPRRDGLRLRGVDEFQAIDTLFAAQDLLDRDPVGGIRYLMRSYGVAPHQLGAQTSGQMGPGAQAFGQQPAGAYPGQPPGQLAGLDPGVLRQLIAEAVTPIQTELRNYRQQSEAEKLAEAQREVQAFMGRPENLYWEDVKNDVAFLLENGRAENLQDAYDTACWANPTIRPLMMAAQAKPPAANGAAAKPNGGDQQKAQAAERERARQAQQAAGSVTGAPHGASAPQGTSTGNLRQDIEAAYQQVSGQV